MLIALPIIIQFATALAALLFWTRPRLQRLVSVTGSAAALIAAVALLLAVRSQGILILPVGNWPPFAAIVLVVDLFSAIMVTISSLMGLAIGLYGLADIELGLQRLGYHPLFHFLLLGVTGAFVTGDLFNLFVWFEIMLLSSFALLTQLGDRPQIEGGLKFVLLNMLSSTFFLGSLGLLYGVAGTVNMAALSRELSGIAGENPYLVITLAMMFTVSFGMKAAVFPLFSWLPASYHTPSTAVTAIFGALSTKVGVYALIRLYTLIFAQPEVIAYARPVLLTLAGLTMVSGVFGAVSQFGLRRLLSFHIISQIGYLIMGLGIYTVASLAGTIFFIVHVILAKSALFLVGGIVERLTGTINLKGMGGFYRTHVGLSLLFFVPAMALAGIPPLSGFWAKFALIKAGLESGQYGIVAVGLFVSILTLYSMIKIWNYAFLRKRPDGRELVMNELSGAERWLRWGPAVLIAGLTIAMGLFAGPLFALSYDAALQAMDSAGYVAAVLGGGG